LETGERSMKKLVLASFLCLLLAVSIAPVYASITVEVFIDDSLRISFHFDFKSNSTMYDEIVAHPEIFNSSSIRLTIMKNLEKQNLEASLSQIPTEFFNNAEKSIHVEFYLGGEDILSYILDAIAATRTYSVKMNWMKFEISLTNTFRLNFTSYFATPISNWQKVNRTIGGNVHPALYYNSTAGTTPFYTACYFILPTTATNIKTVGDTLIFEVPTILEDRLIDSPLLILGGIIIAIIAANLYRKVRK